MNPQVIVGNHYDKYRTQNPIARALMRGFLRAVGELYVQTGAQSVLEVGCGEGRLADHLLRRYPRPRRFAASDLEDVRAADIDPMIDFEAASIYELPYHDDAFDLVICCEVLEHLEDPARALAELARVSKRYVLLSTPWEPVWRLMNLARGRYLRDLGNTPGHLQHFSRRRLRALARQRLGLVALRRPLPWTVILGEVGA